MQGREIVLPSWDGAPPGVGTGAMQAGGEGHWENDWSRHQKSGATV